MDQREWDYGARLPRDRRAEESWSLDSSPESPDLSAGTPKWQSITDTGSLEPSAEALAWAQRADQWAQQPNLPEQRSTADSGSVSRWSEVVPTGTTPADGVGWRTETAEWRATSARWRQTTEWRSSSGTHGWRSTTEAWQTGEAGAEGFSPPAAPPTGGPLAISGSSWNESRTEEPAEGYQQPDGSYRTEQYSPPGETGPAAAPPWQQAAQAAPAAPWQQSAGWQQNAPSPPPPWEGPGGTPPWQQQDDGRHWVREDDRAQWRSAAGAGGVADREERTRQIGRRRAPEDGTRSAAGTGWSTRSESDNWAGYTDTGSMPLFQDPALAAGTDWQSAADAPSWRTETPDSGPRPRSHESRAAEEAPDWRGESRAEAEASDWRARLEAAQWQEPDQRSETPDWRRGPEATGSRRDPADGGSESRREAGPSAGGWRGAGPLSGTAGAGPVPGTAGAGRGTDWRESGAGAEGWRGTASGVDERRGESSQLNGWHADSGPDDRRGGTADRESWRDSEPGTGLEVWRGGADAGGRRAESAGWRDPVGGRRDEGTGLDGWRDGGAEGRRGQSANGRRDDGQEGWRESAARAESWREGGGAGPGADGWRGAGSVPGTTGAGRGTDWRDPDGWRGANGTAPGVDGRRSESASPNGWREGGAAADNWRENGPAADSWREGKAAPEDGAAAGGWRESSSAADGWRENGAAGDGRREGGAASGGWRENTSAAEGWRQGSAAAEGWRDGGAAAEGGVAGDSWRDSGAAGDSWRDSGPAGGSRRGGGVDDWRGTDPAGRGGDEADSRRGAAAEGRRDSAPGTPDSWRTEQISPSRRAAANGEAPTWRDDRDAPDWRANPTNGRAAPDWRESTGTGPAAPDWRESTSSGRAAPDWRENTSSGPAAPDWRESTSSGRAPDWRESTSSGRGAPDWRDNTGSAADWRESTGTGRGAGDPTDWRSSPDGGSPDGGSRAADWRERDAPDWRSAAADPNTPSWRAAGDDQAAPSWQTGRDDDWRTGNAAGADAPSWRTDDAGQPVENDWRTSTSRRRAAELDWRSDPQTEMGETAAPWRRPEPPRPAELEAAPGEGSVGPALWERGDAPAPDRQNWRMEPLDDPRTQAWRQELQAEQAPTAEAATEIRPPHDWQQGGQDGTAGYREGSTGNWRRDMAAESGLADGQAQRFGTSDFVPFKAPTAAGSASVAAARPEPVARSASTTGTGRWQDPPDTQWPPRSAGGYEGGGTGAYERRPVSTLPTASSRQNNLLEPDEDEIEENTGGPLAAVGYTVIWYGVPVVLFVLYMLVLDGKQQGHALSTLATAAPQFGLSLVLSMLVAVGLRWASGSWKAASVGLAAAVMGGGLATVLTSAITGNSLS